MDNWRPQIYRAESPEHYNERLLDNVIAVVDALKERSPTLPPLLTLGHLCHYTDVEYDRVRAIVARQLRDPYSIFRVRKQPIESAVPRFRTVCVPEPTLLLVQRWIHQHVLIQTVAHPASTAFARGCSIKDAAGRHCYARWLIKLDIVNFFESISEIRVSRAFEDLGYQPLIAFELARLCTRLGSTTPRKRRSQWRSRPSARTIKEYQSDQIGHLPQGAPTSPILANLCMKELDRKLMELAKINGLEYSRYADDMTLSYAKEDLTRDKALSVVSKAYALMGEFGLSPNLAKTRIVPPGGRKLVLGLLVDGESPRLTRAFRHRLRLHLHYLSHPLIGPSRHAERRGFASIVGLRNHIWGLIAFAKDVDPDFAACCTEIFDSVDWPT